MTKFNSKAKIQSTSLLVVVVSCSFPALADECDTQSSDKSEYNLFNPVPDDQMRSFATDRPTKSDSPYTVDAGHFQYEADMANWTYNRYSANATTTSNLVVGDPTFKAGLTQNTDLEIALSPLNINQQYNRATNTHNADFGFGDVYTRVKYNLFGNDGGDYVLAIVPYVKAPTASHTIGNDHWEGGGYVPFIASLPDDWTMDITSELDLLENASLNGMHTNYQNLINFNHPLFTDTVTGYVEFWSDVDNDQDTPTQYTLDFAVTWLVKDNLQLDAGINVGLNKASNDLQPYLGISQRF